MGARLFLKHRKPGPLGQVRVDRLCHINRIGRIPWKTKSRDLPFQACQKNLNPQGGHVEDAPVEDTGRNGSDSQPKYQSGIL